MTIRDLLCGFAGAAVMLWTIAAIYAVSSARARYYNRKHRI